MISDTMAGSIADTFADTVAGALVLMAGGAKTGSVSGWLGDLFDISGSTFWVFVAFIIFVALIVWKARGAVTSALDGRAEAIRAEIDEAQRLREEAQALLADYQRKQRDALSEAEGMLRAAEEEAGRLRARAEQDLADSLKRREQQALDRIAQAEAAAQAEVRNMAVDMAVSATRKLLEEKIDGAKASDLIDDAIKDLPGKLH